MKNALANGGRRCPGKKWHGVVHYVSAAMTVHTPRPAGSVTGRNRSRRRRRQFSQIACALSLTLARFVPPARSRASVFIFIIPRPLRTRLSKRARRNVSCSTHPQNNAAAVRVVRTHEYIRGGLHAALRRVVSLRSSVFFVFYSVRFTLGFFFSVYGKTTRRLHNATTGRT